MVQNRTLVDSITIATRVVIRVIVGWSKRRERSLADLGSSRQQAGRSRFEVREGGGDGAVVPQASLIEVAATRRVRVLGSLEDVPVWALAMNVGVGLDLAVCVDRKKAEARRGEEPKDVGREEGGLGDPLVDDGGGEERAERWPT